MIKPSRIFAILGIAICLLIGVMLVFPKGEIKVSDNFSFRFFSLNDLVHPGGPDKVDISGILESEGADTIIALVDTTAITDSFHIDVKEITLVKNRIQYAEASSQALAGFFKALDAVNNKDAHIRILHYGDSQLEGDRISSVIRQKFQQNELFGGCGPGMIPVLGLLQGRIGFKQTNSGNWKDYQVGSKKSPHRKVSLLCEYFMFTPHPAEKTKVPADSATHGIDSLKATSKTDSLSQPRKTAWFKIANYGTAPAKLQAASQAKVLINSQGAPYDLKVTINGSDTTSAHITSAGLLMTSVPVTGNFSSVQVQVSAAQSPEVYGVCLDCESGVSVDNIPLRSAQFTNFSMMDPNILAQQINQLNVGLVVLEFGINVVKNLSGHYKYYEETIYKNIMALKAAVPGVSVLVIGLSDMARKDGTTMASYPNIALIRDAQRNAAFRSGSAFWDLYEAMGGHNSMISWVNNSPPQAEKDYTHFNPAGARVVGKMIYDALMEEYYRYKGVIGGD